MTPNATESQLNELRHAVESWRRSRKPPAGMPDHLWSAAALLAAEVGVGIVVKELRIDHGKLMRLAEQLRPTGKLTQHPRQQKGLAPAARFVEVPAATVAKSFSPALSCMFEVESPGRGRLRAQLDGATALEVATILREFAG